MRKELRHGDAQRRACNYILGDGLTVAASKAPTEVPNLTLFHVQVWWRKGYICARHGTKTTLHVRSGQVLVCPIRYVSQVNMRQAASEIQIVKEYYTLQYA